MRAAARRGYDRRLFTRVVLAAVLVGVAAACVACGGSSLTADSTCRDYVDADRAAQQQAVQQVAQDGGVAYSVLTQNNVDARCSVRPDNTIAWAVGVDETSGSAGTAETPDAADPTETPAADTGDSDDAAEGGNQPADIVMPSKAEQLRLQQQNPCVEVEGEQQCGDAAFIYCSDRVSPELQKQCNALGLPYACGCYHSSGDDTPGYWAKQQ